METKTGIWRGGIPYALDVTRLTEKYPEIPEGLVIKHEELESLLGCKRATQRYYGVVNSWMSKQKNTNGIIMVWVPSIGVKVLDPAGVLEHAETRTRQKSGQLRKAIKTFAWVDRSRLDDVGQKRLDHQVIIAAKIAQAATDGTREMAVELSPIKAMPKRAITS